MRYTLFTLSLFTLLVFISQPIHAKTYKIQSDIIGSVTTHMVQKKESYAEIARKYDLSLAELLRANPDIKANKKPVPGTVLNVVTTHLLPTGLREGIVINLAELRLFYFGPENTVTTFPVAIGREGWETPVGETTIIRKRKDPIWYVPESIKEENPELPDTVPAGPGNPLGAYAISLAWPGYLIHGTNKPYAVGKRTSHGCMRLYPEDIEELYGLVQPGLKVTVIDMPYTLGWQGDTLYLSAVKSKKPMNSATLDKMADYTEIDWAAVEKTVKEHTGMPVAVGKKKGLAATLFR